MKKLASNYTSSWKTKYIVGLSFLAIILVGSQFVLRQYLDEQKFDITILHTATNQRLISQTLAKEALLISQGKDTAQHIAQLKKKLRIFQEAHQNLIRQSNSLGFNDGHKNSPTLQKLYDSLQPSYMRFVVELENICVAVQQKDSAKQQVALAQILENEAQFEQMMDKVVDRYDFEDNAKASTLRWIEWGVLVLSLVALILSGFFVFRPIIYQADNALFELSRSYSELSATEEEVRQNLEENKSIQEALELAYSEMEAMDSALNRGTIVSIGDLKGNILKVNDAFCETSQYTEAELIGKNHSVVNSGHHPKEFWTDMWRTIAKGEIWRGEIKNKAKDGSFYWVDAVISPVINRQGKTTKYLSVRTLITDKKEAEIALVEANKALYQYTEELRATQESFQRSYADVQAMMTALNESAIVSVGDLRGNIIFANDEFCRVSQYAREEILGKNHNIVNSGYHSHEFWKEMWRTVGKGGTWEGEVKNKAKDGSFYWVHAVVTPVYDNNGKIYKYFSVRTLITERKKAEENLKQTKERLELTNQIARIGFWEVDLNYQTMYWSHIAKEIHEVEPDFEPNLATGITFFKKGESRAAMSAMMSKAIQEGTPWDLELQIVTAKGRDVWVRTKGEAEFREGEPTRLFGTFQDIDEKKRNELAIRKLAHIVESSEDAIASIDLDYNVTSWNKGAERIYGYTAEEVLSSPNFVLQLIPSETHQIDEQNVMEQVRQGKTIENYETIRKTKQGNLIHVAISASPLRDAEGNIIGMSKIARDITSKKKAEKELQQKNEDIIASINCAQRIQKAILPLPEEIQTYLPEYFIFFQPRDIVSGDFYYFQEINGKVIVAVADCTGHGVPGAMMTMLGHETLNEIVINKEITAPAVILSELHKSIRKALKQAETKVQEGMDIALLSYDLQNHTVEYAGARNPLVYVHRNETYTIKADNKSIGGEQDEGERVFTQHCIDLKGIGETTFYMFSDGYRDQFGGKQNKKFSLKRLQEMLGEIHGFDLPTQQKIVSERFYDWVKEGKEHQTDDVLLMGIRIY